ncbi:TetR/AcrR family transcriptional regulator [Kibdelosporangium philippinense]|uniref:TetR/AcrR family transcriptional regulator n=1 Tax=Kibdelosporangium philippinense TaxID=211113 RepID=A0ABS8Z1R8_9PSEU|nr:TetR/AcrR family transcriptional regulator [Kibdelosporangium philippinense]MCE7001874.1 TetR/AcrR family transcriptional regulator [Kibdelosporangium philippinense]
MADTKQRILDAARDLFAAQGVQKTSLREIADRLGISKPALYYHFSSREDLVRSIIQPVLDGGEQFLLQYEAKTPVDKRALLDGYFDFHYVHRKDIILFVQELSTLSELGVIELVLAWRGRVAAMLLGPEPTLADSVRATIALGGLQDCTVEFANVPQDELRKVAVDAAWATLGFEENPENQNRTRSTSV